MAVRLDEDIIASRASKEFFDGAVVNLGTGIPALCSIFPHEEKTVLIHVELGLLGVGPPYSADEFEQRDPYLFGAGGQWLKTKPGMPKAAGCCRCVSGLRGCSIRRPAS